MKASRCALLALAATAAAAGAYVLHSDRASAVAGTSTGPSTVGSPIAPASVQTSAGFARAALSSSMVADPFSTSTPLREPARTTVVAAPPPPPPAFSYKYAGTLRHANGTTEAFLLRGTELLPIKPGALLDGGWRVDALGEDRIDVTYLPANERRSLLLAELVAEPARSAPHSPAAVALTVSEQASAGAGGGEPRTASAMAGPAGGLAAARPATPGAAPAGRLGATRPSPEAVAAASGATGPALGAPAPETAGRLGSEPPAQGSMPLGSAPSGSFPKGVTPTGKLGL